jgi:hypothetical protein
MSAFLCSDNHIRALIRAAQAWSSEIHYVHSGFQTWQEIAQELVNENYRSLNYRYRDEEGEPHQITYTMKDEMQRPLDPIVILKLCNCFDYQACETPDWEQSRAFKILQSIKDYAIRKLPGYNDAPWGIE